MARPIFALSAWSTELRADGWWYGSTYAEERKQFRGPYSSLASVTLMIAREMTKEVARRQKRMEDTHAGVH